MSELETESRLITKTERRIVPIERNLKIWRYAGTDDKLQPSRLAGLSGLAIPTLITKPDQIFPIAPEALPTLRRWKMWVTPRESKEIQERVFRLGGLWQGGRREILHTDSTALFCRNGRLFYRCRNRPHFEEQEFPEADPWAMLQTPDEYWFDYGKDLTLPLPQIMKRETTEQPSPEELAQELWDAAQYEAVKKVLTKTTENDLPILLDWVKEYNRLARERGEGAL